jgi:hypothetical protein
LRKRLRSSLILPSPRLLRTTGEVAASTPRLLARRRLPGRAFHNVNLIIEKILTTGSRVVPICDPEIAHHCRKAAPPPSSTLIQCPGLRARRISPSAGPKSRPPSSGLLLEGL